MPTFIGLDLAWTTKNESGICWLEGDSRENLRCTRLEAVVCETEGLADELAAVEGPAVVTIDAPVVYTRDRWSEREISSRFGRNKVGAHSAHAAYDRGYTAGIDLGRALEARGYNLYPSRLLNGEPHGKFAVEVFPHTIHVRPFGLADRLPYKRKKGRDTAFLQRVMQQYQAHLRALVKRECPRVLEHPEVQRALDPATAQDAIGQALKRLDDTLDGITCALAAWLMWKEPDGWEALGDENGYIVVPTESNTPAEPAVIPEPERTEDSTFVLDSPGAAQSVEESEAEPFIAELQPQVLLRSEAPGIEVQVSKLEDGSTWEARVRLQRLDLSRVVAVVEGLEEGPGH